MTMEKNIVNHFDSRFLAKPGITLQVEPDQWGVLYKPDIDFSLGINPETVFLWKQLEDGATIKEIVNAIGNRYSEVPPGIETKVIKLVSGFIKTGFVSVQENEMEGEDESS